jgi:hypothetical protein
MAFIIEEKKAKSSVKTQLVLSFRGTGFNNNNDDNNNKRQLYLEQHTQYGKYCSVKLEA